MAGAPILTAAGLGKAYGPQVVLHDEAVSIHDGERVGLVGVNGSGKSTLARLLAGVEAPDRGEVRTRGAATVMYLEQEPQLDPAATAREIVTSGLSAWARALDDHRRVTERMASPGADLEALVAAQDAAAAAVERLGGWDVEVRVGAMLSQLGVDDAEARVGTMSGGWRRRVALARVLVARPTLAILDEPTNHLDVETIEWLEQYLAEEHEGALLLITHDRYVLDRVVDRTLELDLGALRSFDGGWEDYLTAKAERLAQEARAEANRQSFLRRELEWLRRQPKARTGKQKARIDRARSAEAATPEARRDQVAPLSMTTTRLGKTVVELQGLCVDLGGRRLIADLDLTIGKGERLGVVGANGIGKTTLLRTLLGEIEPAAGRVVLGKHTKLSYLDQTREGLDDDASILDNVAGDLRRITVGGREVDVRAWLGGFLFDTHKQRQLVGALSGGERARVLLARLLLQPANVLLLDEPTNDLDVLTLGALEEMLVSMEGTALVVTHDRYFLDRIATGILSFEGDGRVVRYAGSYQAFRQERRREARRVEAAARPVPAPTPAPEPRERQGLSYREQQELDGIMDVIAAAEAAVTTLEAELSDPDLYATRGREVADIERRLQLARVEVERLVSRWEELESRRA